MSEATPELEKHPAYRPFIPILLRYLRPLALLCLLVIVLEIVATPLLARLLPETWYLNAYLPWEALHQQERFLAHENSIEPDPRLGWRNRPGSSYQNIQYDQYGSRSHQGIQAEQRKAQRIIFLGDSRVYGHIYVENSETINGQLENAQIETLNFAAPRHNLDQSYLAMQDAIEKFQPTAIVIGLGTDVGDELGCMYLPFFSVEDVSMPLLKPRFALADGVLQPYIPPYQEYLASVPQQAQNMLNYLSDHDNCYADFEFYKTWAAGPFLSIASSTWQRLDRFTYNKAEKLGWKRQRPLPNKDLISALLKASKTLAERHDIKLVFLNFPDEFQYQGYQQDKYAEVTQLLEDAQVSYVNVLELFQQAETEDPIFMDEVHFSAEASGLIADELRQRFFD